MPEDLTDEETEQLLTLLDVCLEEGYDITGTDEATLEAARDKLRELHDAR